jgi:aurora kinase
MINNNKKIQINEVANRFLPLSKSVQNNLENEVQISDFEILKILGQGSFGKVFLSKHKKTNAIYAIKVIDKTDKNNIEGKPYFQREIEIMYKLNHKNCIKLYSHFEDNNYCYFIMEYISNGNLLNYIKKKPNNKLEPKEVSNIIKELISAVYYLHNMSPPIIHRDIKPENILLNENNIIKLTDFGWSNYMKLSDVRSTFCGTPLYLAPEMIISDFHNEKVDIWCIGIILFELLVGRVPFNGMNKRTLINNIINCNIIWDNNIDIDAKDLISKILIIDPNKRISLNEMMKHNFITKYNGNCESFLIKPCNDNFIEEPFIVSLETPESHLEKINKKKKKMNEEKEIEQKIEKSPKLKSEQVNLLKRVESLLNNEKNKHKKDYILLNESYINFTNLFSQYIISQKENSKNLEILEKQNSKIFKLENRNFILEEMKNEKDKIIEEKNKQIEKYKNKLNEQKKLIKELYFLMNKNENNK